MDLLASDSLVMPSNQAVHPMLVLVVLAYGRSELIGKSDVLINAGTTFRDQLSSKYLFCEFDSHLASDNV